MENEESSTTDQELLEAVHVLSHQLDRYNSIFWMFIKGIVIGLGTALGATVVAGAVFYWSWSALVDSGLTQYMHPAVVEQFESNARIKDR